MRKAIQALLLLAFVFVGGRAYADDRGDARAHYQAGVKLYNGGDYRGAIKEFGAAQQLVPADLNSYNLALCYDKLGEAEPAIQYYKEYLAKVPNTDKKAEIEASVSRLDAAMKSASSKKAEEDKKAADARAAEDARKADEARKADDARRAQEDAARKAQEDARRVEESRNPAPPTNVPPTSVGSTGTPSTGSPAATGDAQLDRVQGIDINSIRDQRNGTPTGPTNVGASSNPGNAPNPNPGANPPPANNLGTNPGMSPSNATGAPPPTTTAGVAPGPNGLQPNGTPVDTTKPAETPVYKKWWFWAVVAVSAYVVYEIASDNSSNNNSRAGREMPLNGKGGAAGMPGGFTLIRW